MRKILNKKMLYIILISLIIFLIPIKVIAIDNPDFWEPSGNYSTIIVQKGASVAGVVQVIGISIAVIVLMGVGIKFMLGSPEQKAEYKTTLLPYTIGAVIVFAISTILNIIFSILDNLL